MRMFATGKAQVILALFNGVTWNVGLGTHTPKNRGTRSYDTRKQTLKLFTESP